MKILAISDTPDDRIHSPKIRDRFGDVGAVISCGDLPNEYLEYIVTLLNVPVFYVLGNHDAPGVTGPDGQKTRLPEGCINLDNRVVRYRGLILAGFEGSMAYSKANRVQYTEWQMRRKIRRLVPRLWWNRLRWGRPLDILVTHAPPLGIHDGEDLCHTGFQSLRRFDERYSPAYHIHGHRHIYEPNEDRITPHGLTTVVNAYGHQVIEVEDNP